jgi:putative methionine-R-sulfoxide reductase with GAF domain
MTATGALEAVERILNRGGEADDVLRDVVRALVERGRFAWAGILFVEEGRLVLGPEAGEPQPRERTQIPVPFNGEPVAELVVDGAVGDDRAALERVAVLIGGHCLVGWDTGGEAWEP